MSLRAFIDGQAGHGAQLHVQAARGGGRLAWAALRPAIGLQWPRYAYHVGCVVHASRELGLFKRQRTLLLSNDHTGASELDGIGWSDTVAPAQAAGALSLLVQAALLWMAQHRSHYADRLVVPLPGVRDGSGQSPFWAGLGQAFVEGDPTAIAHEHGEHWKSHLASLLPRHPVYASFLGAAAQAAIAQCPPSVAPLLAVLEHEGLRYGHHIDLHDGGPVLEAVPEDLLTLHASRALTVELLAAIDATSAHAVLLQGAAPSVVHVVAGRIRGPRLLMSPDAAAAASIAAGARVRAVPLVQHRL